MFTPADVVSFTRTGGVSVPVSAIVPVAGTSNTAFDVTFAPQPAVGVYTLVLGPDIRDTLGNALDQNNNLIPGEDPGDRYTTSFSIFGPRVTAGTQTAPQPAAISRVHVTFNRAMDPSTFTVGDIVSFMRPDGQAIPIVGVAPVAGTGSTQFAIDFTLQGMTGGYTLVLGPDIRDTLGNPMDQNNNFVAGEVPADRYTLTFNILGTRILSSTPTGQIEGPVKDIRIAFNRAMDATTFTPSDIISLTRTGGVTVPVLSITPVLGTSTQFDINVPSQTAVGVTRSS